jgi:hypothetical protein
MTLTTIINFLSSDKQPELYTVVGTGVKTGSRNVHSFEKSQLSTESRLEEVKSPGVKFLRQYILVHVFRKSSPFEKVYTWLSLLTATFFGFAILGAFTYHYGDIDDNSEASFRDAAEDYYIEDLKMVSIALALVIPVVLPIRLIYKLTGILKALAVGFTILILAGSIIGVLTMGAIFCWGAMMRCTISYLIYTPLEFLISELILASLLHLAGVR